MNSRTPMTRQRLGEIRAERTTNSLGHYTLWGDAVAILAFVVAVRPVAGLG